VLKLFYVGLSIGTAVMLWAAPASASAPAAPGGLGKPSWMVVKSPVIAGFNVNLTAVAAVSGADAWAVGQQNQPGRYSKTLIEHWNGTAWAVVPSPSPDDSDMLNAVTATSATNAWAVGSSYSVLSETSFPLAEHWNGRRWQIVPVPGEGILAGVAAVPGTDQVLAVGLGRSGALAEHWNGSRWSAASLGIAAGYLMAVSADSPTDAWAAGDDLNGTLEEMVTVHWNGSRWSTAPQPTVTGEAGLDGLAIGSGHDAWAVGSSNGYPGGSPLSEHWNGSAWRVVPVPDPSSLQNLLTGAAAVPGTTRVWAVGYYQAGASDVRRTLIEMWNGNSWAVVPSPDTGTGANALQGVAVTPGSGRAWAVGYDFNGTLDKGLVEVRG
jgi:hypothetical protein